MAQRCIAGFVDFRGGYPEMYNPGRLVDDADPVIKGREGYFEPVEVAVARFAGVEQTTAAPGERRSRSKPRKTATAAPAADGADES